MQKSRAGSIFMGLAIGAAASVAAVAMSNRGMRSKVKHGAERAINTVTEIIKD